MKKNIGRTDKYIRIIGGVVILLLGIYFRSWLGLLGFIPLVLAFMGWCPIYTLLGVDTCPLPQNEEMEEDAEIEKEKEAGKKS